MQRIYDTIQKFDMIRPGMQVLAGVSGGADSVCLLLALAEYRRQMEFTLIAVHVEHGIRGEESLADAAYVAGLCRAYQVELVTEHCDAAAEARRRGQSVEEAGRNLRYEIFERIRQERGADRIAVAHNQNDQAETMLWNLVRGSGLRGLGGIRPVREKIIRPLLFLERREIEQILTKRGIVWRTDRTNLETEYTRNRIRLQLLPEMERSLNGNAVSHIAQAAARLQEVQDYLAQETDRAAQQCIRIAEEVAEDSAAHAEHCWKDDNGNNRESCSFRQVFLDLERFHHQQPLIQKELLKRCLKLVRDGSGLKDIGSVHLEALLALCEMPCGKECHLPGRITAVRERQEVRFWKTEVQSERPQMRIEKTPMHMLNQNSDSALSLNRKFRLGSFTVHTELLPNSPEIMQKIQKEKKYTKWLSYDTINSNACFRKRRAGDYLVVNEDGGRRKLKDYLIDQKIPRAQRDSLWLLADGSHILWVVGWRISEAAKIKKETEKVLKIQIEEVLE